MGPHLHTRHRRFLSSTRSTGAQVPPAALAGRAERHAEGWRDQLDDDGGLDAAKGILGALGFMLLLIATGGVLYLVLITLMGLA